MRTSISSLAPVITIAFLALACGTSRPYVHKKAIKDAMATYEPSSSDRHFFLIGDAGKPQKSPLEPSLQLLKHKLEATQEKSAVVFLGDNIYTYGLPPVSNESLRAQAEERINTQLGILENYRGHAFFIPGNHDWNNAKSGGLVHVKEEQEYIMGKLGKKDVWYPKNGCGGPAVIPLFDGVKAIALDTEWWLHDWSEEIGMNDHCNVKSREAWLDSIRAVLKRYKNDHLIVMGHHPLYTNGPHGGYFSWKQHLFPLTEGPDWLYLPMPGLGSLYPLIRRLGISRQDLGNQHYASLKENLVPIFKAHPDLLYAAGHEHNLQYFQQSGNHYVVSGAGSKLSYCRRKKNAVFSHSHKGFAQLTFTEGNDILLRFWVPDETGNSGKVVFSYWIVEED